MVNPPDIFIPTLQIGKQMGEVSVDGMHTTPSGVEWTDWVLALNPFLTVSWASPVTRVSLDPDVLTHLQWGE